MKYAPTYLHMVKYRHYILEKNWKYITTNMRTYIQTIIKAERVFIMQSFLFHKQNKSFHDRFISLVLDRKVLQLALFPPFLPDQK